MRLLLTGANGFTGKYFTDLAKVRGYQVYPLYSDLLDKKSLFSEINSIQPEFVVHLAGISFVNYENKNIFYSVNTVGTINLLEVLSELDIRLQKILLASSANLYGNSPNSPICESESPNPLNHYAGSKLIMEQLAKNYFGKLPILITRPFNYTGSGQSENFLIPKLIKHFVLKSPIIQLGNIDISREFNNVIDVCNIYIQLLSKGEIGEIYNVCSGVSYKLMSIIDLLTKLTKHTISIEEKSELIRNDEVLNLYGTSKKLQTCIGDYKFISFEDTLKQMLMKCSRD